MRIDKYSDYKVKIMNFNILNEDINSFCHSFLNRKEIHGKTILITGATGLLGSLLVKCLFALKEDVKIICQVRDENKAKEIFSELTDSIIIYQCPLSEITNCDKRIDYIIHLAAPTASRFFVDFPVETIKTIVDGTQNVLQLAKKLNVKSIVFASSLEVYGIINNDNVALSEDVQGYINPLDERSSYPIAKRMAECLCYSFYKQHNTPVKIARLAQTFGPGISYNDGRVFAYLARAIVEERDIILNSTGELSRTYCYTMDAISALLYILMKGEDGNAYNVGNENTYISVINLAKMLQSEFLPTINIVIKPETNMGFSPVTKLHLDTSRIRRLGWEPQYELIEMFRRLISYLK